MASTPAYIDLYHVEVSLRSARQDSRFAPLTDLKDPVGQTQLKSTSTSAPIPPPSE
ncbi:hypothetical protein FRC07_008189, partial [Ceratobasidium sp. 392]